MAINRTEVFRDLDQKCMNFNQLLKALAQDQEGSKKEDEIIICNFCNIKSIKSLNHITEEVYEVLFSLEPFPWDWVYVASGYKKIGYISGKDEREKYYKWIAWITEIVEKKMEELVEK